MQPEKGELIPVAALKNDLPVLPMRKAAAAQALGIPQLQNGPFAVLKDIGERKAVRQSALASFTGSRAA